MATKLRNLRLDRVDLVDRGANPAAHITLFKRADSDPREDSIMPDTTCNAASAAFVRKAVTAHPTLASDEAIVRYAAAHPDEYEQTRRAVSHGVTTSTRPAATIAPLAKSAARAALTKAAAVLVEHGVCTSTTTALPLAAQMFPALYAAHAGHPMVTKSAPSADALLKELAEHFRQTRDGMRHNADRDAADLTAAQCRAVVTALLNTVAGA